MDSYEYKLRSEEIKRLIKERDYKQAIEIADTIDWTKVRSSTTLCTISDLYKINRRYSEAKILLEQAYSRKPNDAKITYALCDLSIMMDDVIGATEYYKAFTRIAPTDNGKFILLYKIYEAQEVSLEQRIEVLEELKKRDYTAKWGYELAYLYHRVGLATKCVEECDDLVMWFREGKYVKKAMELKMLHQQLTESQQTIYDSLSAPKRDQEVVEQKTVYMTGEIPRTDESDNIQVKTMDVSQYSTINIQKALAESMKDVLVAENGFSPLIPSEEPEPEQAEEPVYQEASYTEEPADIDESSDNNDEEISENAESVHKTGSVTEALLAPLMMQDTGELQELFSSSAEDSDMAARITEGVDSSQIVNSRTDDTSDEIPLDEYINEREKAAEEPENTDDYTQMMPVIRDEDLEPENREPARIDEEPIVEHEGLEQLGAQYYEGPKDAYMKLTKPYIDPDSLHIQDAPVSQDTMVYTPHRSGNVTYSPLPDIDMSKASKEDLMELINQKVQEALDNALNGGQIVTPDNRYANMSQATPPVSMQKMLSQEYDGQISLVMPEQEKVEKQITGQMNIQDVLDEWENTKKHSQERYQEQLKQRLTGTLFTDIERDELLKRSDIQAAEPVVNRVVTPELAADKPATAKPAIEEELPEVEELEEIAEPETGIEAAIDEAIDRAEAAEEPEEAEAVAEETFEEEESEAGEEAEEPETAETVVEEAAESEPAETTEEAITEAEEVEPVAEDESAESTEAESEEEPAADEVSEADTSESEAEETESTDTSNDETSAEPEEQAATETNNNAHQEEGKDISDEDLAIFSNFVQTKQAKRDLLRELDKISLASYTGNVFVTGDANDETVELAKAVLKYAQNADANFTGKTGKISGIVLNTKSVATMIEKLNNGGLIIEKASGMNAETTKELLRVLNQDKQGVLIIMQDTAKAMRRMVEHFDGMREMFNVHVKVEELSDDTLVAYGRKYAEHMEFSIDEMGMLALHTRIEAMQTSDHIVTVADVRDIVDSAINRAKKKNLKHFSDILLGKRYDDEDMIILKERDFDN